MKRIQCYKPKMINNASAAAVCLFLMPFSAVDWCTRHQYRLSS